MMGLSLPHLALIAIVVLVLFGRGRVSDIMGDFGKGIKSFKEGLADEANPTPPAPPAQIEVKPEVPAQPAPTDQKTGQN